MSDREGIRVYLRSERGAILFLSLGIMVILLSLALMFAAVTTSRNAITNNQKDALQVRCIAESAIAHALSVLSVDPGSESDINVTNFAGGTYSVDVNRFGVNDVELTATAEYRDARYKTRMVVKVPPPTGVMFVWSLREGDPAYSWADSYLAHDDARGPNANYAVIMKGQKAEQGLAGFRVRSVPYPIAKVEFVIHYRIPLDFKKGQLEVRWRRLSDDMMSPWKIISNPQLVAAAPGGLGFTALDTTSDAPPDGWNWEVFMPEPDFQIELKQSGFLSKDRLLIDCAGFRISW